MKVGVDMIEIERVERTLAHYERFRERVFTNAEREYCESRPNPPQHYAARFAAKEAALKALGTGWTGGIAWQDVEVVSETTGAPALLFHNLARELFQRSGARVAHLSISHTSEHAIAQVVLEN